MLEKRAGGTRVCVSEHRIPFKRNIGWWAHEGQQPEQEHEVGKAATTAAAAKAAGGRTGQQQQQQQQQQIQSSNAAAAKVAAMRSSSPITPQPTDAVKARAKEDQQRQGLGTWL